VETPLEEFHRDLLRSARAEALADAEGFYAVLHSLELIGQQLTGKVRGLGYYRCALSCLADDSPLSDCIPSTCPKYHTKFPALYDELRQARNDAVHQGAHARTLTEHAVEITIILEDALMSETTKVSQFMVRNVVQAEPWHPVSYVRQQMLKYAFSFLPIREENAWRLISEWSLAQYLRGASPKNNRNNRLATSIRDAVDAKELRLLKAETAAPDDSIDKIVKHMCERPILVVDADHGDALVGMLTSSDVL